MTHNIEGHERSNNSCQQLIAKLKPDFFLRQEDWLFGYQHFKLSQKVMDRAPMITPSCQMINLTP